MDKDTVRAIFDGAERRRFMCHVLDDLRTLDRMIDAGCIETGFRRIGAEQELFLIDRSARPAAAALDVLAELQDANFTTELALFNLEINLDPHPLAGDSLERMERQLEALMGRLRHVCGAMGIDPLMIGILPTLGLADLGLDRMTPSPRYQALNRAMSALRGGAYEFSIKGLDEILLQHESVMLEACNASFQIHLQVDPGEFANVYNCAQAAAGPVLAISGNSPLLFGRRLWAETRIALFQQAIDTRSSTRFLRERSPRVTFGTRWVENSVLELFQEDIARFPALVTSDDLDASSSVLAGGAMPRLQALRLFNGTVYRWNRACYGLNDGHPHLRIENRVLPSGPSIVDQFAGAALWYGLVLGLARRHADLARVMDFDEARTNFGAAAREGLEAQLRWFGETLPVKQLIESHLLPIAREGLQQAEVDGRSIDRYFDVIASRLESTSSGSRWQLRSLQAMRGGTLGERLTALTAATLVRQRTKASVAAWPLAQLDEGRPRQHNPPRVEQYMTSDLFTVTEDEPLDLVASLMDWRRIRHVPVEDAQHRLIGLVSYRSLLRWMARGKGAQDPVPLAVSAVMKREPVTIEPEATILEAMGRMRRHRIACLPVVRDGKLVGVITERDLMPMAAELLEEKLGS